MGGGPGEVGRGDRRRRVSATASRFECLGLGFSVDASDPIAREVVEHLYAPCRTEAEPTIRFALRTVDAEKVTHVVTVDDAVTQSTDRAHLALAHLVWEISQAVVAAATGPSTALLHAASASDASGRAVLLPAASGSGKSTLVTALIERGLGYLTDDISAVDLSSGLIRPYPKPISTPVRLRRKFEHAATIPDAHLEWLGDEGFITAADVGAVIASPAAPRMIVSPRYTPNAGTELTELSRAAAVRLLIDQSFGIGSLGNEALTFVGALVADCRCYSLVYSDLAEAAAVVIDALGTDPAAASD